MSISQEDVSMSNKLINGARIEDLATELVDELKADRETKGRFEFLKVAVANPNLGNWLKMKVLAKKPELSAGVEMPFLTEELERILRENCEPGLEIVSGRDYPLLILNILMKDGRDEYAPFCKYIKEKQYKPGPLTIVSQREARRAVQLANRLGQIIDDYEAMDYLSLLEEFKDKSDVYKGEQALVEAMKDVKSLRKVFDSVKESAPKGVPEKFILFGHTTLTPIQREMLEWVAKTHEVIWYQPKAEVKPLEGVAVRVVGAPGIRREVEMVHENILKAVWDHNEDGRPVKKEGVNFSDIAVLVADMPKYRAMIESVFEGRGQVPYGLIDATTQNYSTYLDGFLALMDIARYGLNRERLFAALDNPCVQLGMGFTREDVNAWRKLADCVGGYEGYEAADSDEKNVSGKFDWSWALQRLRLGLVAERLEGLELEALDGDAVEKFSEVVETLHRRLSALNGIRVVCSSDDEKEWPSTWAGRLHGIMDEFLAADAEDALETKVRAGIVRALNSLGAIEGEQSYRLPLAVVENSVSGVECAKGGYLRHGVTIGGLRSLAHVPFKRIFVIGLSEGTLPGKNDRSTLDVRNEVENRKDVLRADENRARFAAAVSSAREELVLSYPCLDLQTDAELYPSSLVRAVVGDRKPEYYPLETVSAVSTDQVLDPGGAEPEKMKQTEPTAKDFAEFVKDPYEGVFSRRFKIDKEAYRDNVINEATPLGVPKGPPQWELEKAMMKKELPTSFKAAEDCAEVPTSYLGAFARTKLESHQIWADQNISDEDRKILKGEVEESAYSLVCRYFNPGTDDEPITIPPSAVLEPFYERLVRYIQSGVEADFELKIRVIAFDVVVLTWEWKIQRMEAEAHLQNILTWYGKVPLAVSYDELRKVLQKVDNAYVQDAEWGGYAAGIMAEREKNWKKVRSGLVIGQNLNRWRREPDGLALKELFEKIFKLPMSGKIVRDEEKGAQA